MGTSSTTRSESYDVAIVGFGPVGAALAGLLGRRGRKVAVFDKAVEIFPLPRAIGLDHEALRVLQRIAEVDDLIPHTAPYRPSVYLGCDGQPILRFDMAPPPFPLGWRPNYTFNQPKLEGWLRDNVQALPNVDVRLGVEVTGLQEDSENVVLSLGGERIGRVQAKYVVGCDGAGSMVRRVLGISRHDLQFDEQWLVIDMIISDKALARLPETNIQNCQPTRPSTYVVLPGNHRRWELMVNHGEQPDEMLKPEVVWKLLADWVRPDEARLWRAACYRFHAVIADRWRSGRNLLAGDSAHQMPPFLAQGMCQGLRDAANLEWKLDLVLGGQSSATLLDSYEEERKPNVIEVTHAVKQLGKVICERDPTAAQRRDKEMRESQGGVIKTKIRQDLIPGLKEGILSPNNPGAGLIFPQPILQRAEGDSVMLDDLTGTGFRIAVNGGYELPEALLGNFLFQNYRTSVIRAQHDGTISSDGIECGTDPHRQLTAWFARHQCSAAVVRPDGYVYGTASQIGDLPRLLSELTSKVLV